MTSITPDFNELAIDVDKPLQLSNRVLSQSEGIHAHFYTITFARYATRNIPVGAQGQRLYNHCLTNLPIHRSADERLSFGWGEETLLRNAGVQLFEYNHLVLGSALGEYFSEDYGAAILSAIADKAEDEKRPKPHRSSLREFAHASNGIMATSEFPIAVDDMIRLNPYRNSDDGMPFAKQPQETICVPRFGEALIMLGQLKSGELKELTLAGGDVLGWFAAFAELCIGVDVTLETEDGRELHRANANGGGRLKLRFTPLHSRPSDSSVLWLMEESLCTPSTTIHSTIHSGRISQNNSLLIKVFGNAFHRLDQMEGKTLANALGGTAQNYSLMAKKEDISPKIVSPENKLNLNGQGIGLINTFTNWFPELRHLSGRMERALKLDKKGADQQCEDSILHLEKICACYICSPTVGTDDKPTNLPKDGFCISTLMETILMLGLALSRVALTPNLQPSRAGLLNMYKSQMRKRLELKARDIPREGPERFWILFGSDLNSTFPKRLANVIAMFSGSWPKHDLPENMIGMSHEGICAYSMMLERGNKRGKHPDDQVIRVVTGSINWRQKSLSRICLGPVESDGIDVSWDNIQCDHISVRLDVK